jgi:hypothetical protein
MYASFALQSALVLWSGKERAGLTALFAVVGTELRGEWPTQP